MVSAELSYKRFFLMGRTQQQAITGCNAHNEQNSRYLVAKITFLGHMAVDMYQLIHNLIGQDGIKLTVLIATVQGASHYI